MTNNLAAVARDLARLLLTEPSAGWTTATLQLEFRRRSLSLKAHTDAVGRHELALRDHRVHRLRVRRGDRAARSVPPPSTGDGRPGLPRRRRTWLARLGRRPVRRRRRLRQPPAGPRLTQVVQALRDDDYDEEYSGGGYLGAYVRFPRGGRPRRGGAARLRGPGPGGHRGGAGRPPVDPAAVPQRRRPPGSHRVGPVAEPAGTQRQPREVRAAPPGRPAGTGVGVDRRGPG